MNSLNLDPGLRQAFTQQTHQRLLAESSRARLVNRVAKLDRKRYEAKQYTLRGKIKVISEVIKDSAAIIVSILKDGSSTASV